MTNYREILRLSSLGFNKTQIAQSVGYSKRHVLCRCAAEAAGRAPGDGIVTI